MTAATDTPSALAPHAAQSMGPTLLLVARFVVVVVAGVVVLHVRASDVVSVGAMELVLVLVSHR